jgi:hypothetical protein
MILLSIEATIFATHRLLWPIYRKCSHRRMRRNARDWFHSIFLLSKRSSTPKGRPDSWRNLRRRSNHFSTKSIKWKCGIKLRSIRRSKLRRLNRMIYSFSRRGLNELWSKGILSKLRDQGLISQSTRLIFRLILSSRVILISQILIPWGLRDQRSTGLVLQFNQRSKSKLILLISKVKGITNMTRCSI